MIYFLPSFSSVLALFLLGHAFSFTLAAVKYRFLFIGFIKEFIYGKWTASFFIKKNVKEKIKKKAAVGSGSGAV
jgi:hypothetical protein